MSTALVTYRWCLSADLYPVPPDCSLDNGFDLSAFQGRWYITGAGQGRRVAHGCCASVPAPCR